MNLSSIERHYSEGLYWQNRRHERSSYKINLLMKLIGDPKSFFHSGFKGAEIGCGNGAYLLPLEHEIDKHIEKFSLVGFDIAPNAIKAAIEDNEQDSHIQFLIGSAEDIREKVDCIFLMDVVEHVENPYSFMRKLKGKSKYIIVHLPLEHSFGHIVLGKPTKSYNDFKHIHFFSWETANILFRETGFSVDKFQFTGSVNETLSSLTGPPSTKILRKLRYYLYKCFPTLAINISGGSVMVILRNSV